MARNITLWVSGIVASSIVGGGIGDHVTDIGGSFWGIIAGASAFTCVRLWLVEQKRRTSN